MARPSKPSSITNKAMSEKDRKARSEVEKKLKGVGDKINHELHLTTRQIKIFKFIKEELRASEILGNLDKYILSQTAIVIDRINECEATINNEGLYIRELSGALTPNPLIKVRNDYMKDYFRCCNELSLSPQARAKFGNINVTKSKKDGDALLKVLGGGMID